MIETTDSITGPAVEGVEVGAEDDVEGLGKILAGLYSFLAVDSGTD